MTLNAPLRTRRGLNPLGAARCDAADMRSIRCSEPSSNVQFG